MVELYTASHKLIRYVFCLVSFCINVGFQAYLLIVIYSLFTSSFLSVKDDYFQHLSKKSAAVSCWLTRSQSCDGKRFTWEQEKTGKLQGCFSSCLTKEVQYQKRSPLGFSRGASRCHSCQREPSAATKEFSTRICEGRNSTAPSCECQMCLEGRLP